MNPPRTTATLVINLFAAGGQEYDGITDLTPYIVTATKLVDKVAAMAALKGLPLPMSDGPDAADASGSDWGLIERWLAAHFYVTTDRAYSSRSTQGGSGSFMSGQTEKGFGSTEYGRNAIALDYSGTLENLGKKERARLSWLGKPPSAQIPVQDRD